MTGSGPIQELGSIIGLRFYTNKGLISPILGLTGSRTVMEYVPGGFRIIGFYMHWAGFKSVGLKFYYAKSVLPTY